MSTKKFPILIIVLILCLGHLSHGESVEENLIKKKYFDNGQLSSEISHQDGKREGLAKWYFKNGVLEREQLFKNNEPIGVGKFYSQNGELAKELYWEKGKLIKLIGYAEKGNIATEINIKDQKSRAFDINGDLKEEYSHTKEEMVFTCSWFLRDYYPSESSYLIDTEKACVEVENDGNVTPTYVNFPSYCKENLSVLCLPISAPDYNNDALKNAQRLYQESKYEDTLKYTQEFISLYDKKAKATQASLNEYPWESKEIIFSFKELNDVALALFIKAEALFKLGRDPEARETLKMLIDDYYYGQCWCPQGVFIKPSEIAQQRLNELND